MAVAGSKLVEEYKPLASRVAAPGGVCGAQLEPTFMRAYHHEGLPQGL